VIGWFWSAAAALEVPVIALFEPTSEVHTGPYGTGHCVLTGEVPCRPCFSRVCRHAPELECLHLIRPNDLAAAERRVSATHAMPS
jgi:ADP-heptose:LPS heptosyltransferase